MPNMKDLRDMAKDLKVKNYSRMRKDTLIHSIQSAEGNSPCYGTIPDCGLTDCLYYSDCMEFQGQV